MLHRYFGIDMSAKTFNAAFLDRKAVHEQAFPNKELGWAGLYDWAKEQCPNAQLRFCVEHTGRYEQGLVQYLQGRGAYVSVIDSSRLHYYTLSKGNRGKSDSADARALAQYARDRKPEEYQPRPESYEHFLQLCRLRDSFVKERARHINKSKAPGILATIREHHELHIAVITESLNRIQVQISEVEAALPRLQEEVEILDMVSGIGLVQSRQLIAELGPIESYSLPERVALAGGLVPLSRQSGTSLNKRSLMTYGNPRLRAALYRAAITAKKHDPAFKAYAKRIESNGNKSKQTVNIACARKMAHVVWAVLTYKRAYDPEILMKDSRLT